MIPAKGEEPGAFVLTSKKDGQKYVMSERTLKQVVEKMGEENFDTFFTGEWVLLNEEERKLAEELTASELIALNSVIGGVSIQNEFDIEAFYATEEDEERRR